MEETFTKVIDILYSAKQDEIEIILNDGRLQLQIPENKSINPDLLNEIKVNKEQIINFLSNENWKLNRVNIGDKITRIDSTDRPTRIPLSFSQERLWFIDQLDGSLQYHITAVLRLRGKLNVSALENSLKQIVNRHEVLRTVYREENGEPYQVIKPLDSWNLNIVDDLQLQDDSAALQKYIKEQTSQPFNLSEDNMLRAWLISIKEDEHVMALSMHHIASDAWSTPILVKEIAELYDSHVHNREARLGPLPLQYADYVLWQKGYLQGKVLDQKLTYWKDKLADVLPLDLPSDYSRPSVSSTRGASAAFSIPPKILQGIKQLNQAHGTTLYMTLLAAFKVLLYRYSGQEDICVGTSIAGRPQKDLEGLIGFFVNTLALRNKLDGQMPFNELLEDVKQTMLGAYNHQEVPFDRIVEAVVKERDSGRNPLFDVMLVLKNTPEVPKVHFGELELSGEPYEHNTVKFDLTFFLTQTGDNIQGSVLFNTDLYKRDRIEQMIEHFLNLLQSIVASPLEKIGTLAMLAPTEEQNLRAGINVSNYLSGEDKTVVEMLFEENVNRSPQSVALKFEGRKLTYQDLEIRSNQLAHYLQSIGIKKDTLVPLYMEPGFEMIIALIGILKSGGAYVPIDINFPADRVNFILDDTRAEVLLTSRSGRLKLENPKVKNILELDREQTQLNTFPEIAPSNTISP
ncbi:MAG: AMP-binding protein, partial [Pyrinomonadaceae bacterium]|nr:AMP-binding protein [Sphingobacteriaceae bacterium]